MKYYKALKINELELYDIHMNKSRTVNLSKRKKLRINNTYIMQIIKVLKYKNIIYHLWITQQ